MEIKIGSRTIGDNSPAFIIAELSCNHAQDKKIAIDTVYAVKEAGADAIKLQTYTPDTITIDCDNPHFQITQGTLWDGQTLHNLYKTAYTPWEWHAELFEHAKKAGLISFSSPFDPTAVKFLADLNVPAFKIASFEVNDIPLIRLVAKQGKPVIISTGIATLEDIDEAVKVCRAEGNNQIALLKCTSAYPAKLVDANLRTIPDLANRFGVIAGLSDHTLGSTAPSVAVALGARIIEKHFILDKKIGGPDLEFSLDPKEFGEMVRAVRDTEAAMGRVDYELTPQVVKNRAFSRSLFVVKPIKAGEIFTAENIRSIRPGMGLHTRHLDEILGKRATRDIEYGTPLAWELIK